MEVEKYRKKARKIFTPVSLYSPLPEPFNEEKKNMIKTRWKEVKLAFEAAAYVVCRGLTVAKGGWTNL